MTKPGRVVGTLGLMRSALTSILILHNPRNASTRAQS